MEEGSKVQKEEENNSNETFVEWISRFIPTSFYDWYHSKMTKESDSASKSKEEKMNDVVKQLQFIFNDNNSKKKEELEEEWHLLEEQFDGLDLESSWISINCNPDEVGEEEKDTVTWFGNMGGILPYVTFVKPSNWTGSSPSITSSTPSTPQVEEIEVRLKRQADELQMMRNQLEMLSRSLSMSQISSSGSFSSGFPSLNSSTMSYETYGGNNTKEEEQKVVEDEQDPGFLPPPPPPPPVPGQLPQIKAMGTIVLKPKIHVKTRREIELELEQLINDSDLVDLNKPKAVANFIRSFPERSEKHAKVLEKMVLNYPFLIKRFPLQPKTCFKRFQLWEEHLFEKMDDENSSIKSQNMRRKKTIEIEKLGTSTEILAEIKNIFAFLEAEKRKELEKEKAKKMQDLQSSMVSELQGKLLQVAQKDRVQKAELEMSVIESEEILI